MNKVFNTVFQPGQHVILFGDRGVGKTSLANRIFDILVMAGEDQYLFARANCSEHMDFESLWRGIFRQFEVPAPDGTITTMDDSMIGPLPENVLEVFKLLKGPSIIVIDELDRITDEDIQTGLADTIKTLSDNAIETTLIMVGVADSIDQLTAEHKSIDRAITEVQLPPMRKTELIEIVENGCNKCGMTVDDLVKERLADFANGFPSYTHLLARGSALNANEDDRTHITMADLAVGIQEAVTDKTESNLSAYNLAVTAPRGQNFKPALLACALAPTDEQGFFLARDVVTPLRIITGKNYGIPAFAKHLKAFRDESRGPILERRGTAKTYRYRFVHPLMRPFVILQGLYEGLIREEQFNRPSAVSTEPEQLSLKWTSVPQKEAL